MVGLGSSGGARTLRTSFALVIPLLIAATALGVTDHRPAASRDAMCAQTFAACSGLHHLACRYAVIGRVLGRARLEVDLYGSHTPGCQAAKTRLARTAAVTPPDHWTTHAGWRCRWRPGEDVCRRRHAVIWAIDPGG